MIPKIINYCWFGRNPLPNDVKQCISSWKTKCPDYQIIQWNEDNFDVNANHFTREAYKNRSWAFVSDYARLKIIYENGGIYLDTDVELLKNLDQLLDNDCYIGMQQSESLCNTGLGFGAIRHSLVVKEMLDQYSGIDFDKNNLNLLACPYLNTKAISKFGDFSNSKITKLEQVTIFPPEFFDPYSNEILLSDKTISVHHYSASWTKGTQRLKRQVAGIIGTRNAVIIRNFFKKTLKRYHHER